MKFQLHVSGLNMLSKCGPQFERRYINGEKLPPSVSITIGTAVDRSVTADLGNKIQAGYLLPEEQVKAIARDAVVTEWDRGVEVKPDDKEEGIGSKDGAIDASVALAALHHREAAPLLKPTHVQRAWALDINGLDIQLAGCIDIQEGLRSIHDTKTSGKSPSKDTADTSTQLTTYALAVRQCDGRCPDVVALDYLVRTEKPKLVQLESRRTDSDFPHLLERIYLASRIIESGLFMPAPVDAWWCSSKWCGYWGTCRYAARPVSAAV